MVDLARGLGACSWRRSWPRRLRGRAGRQPGREGVGLAGGGQPAGARRRAGPASGSRLVVTGSSPAASVAAALVTDEIKDMCFPPGEWADRPPGRDQSAPRASRPAQRLRGVVRRAGPAPRSAASAAGPRIDRLTAWGPAPRFARHAIPRPRRGPRADRAGPGRRRAADRPGAPDRAPPRRRRRPRRHRRGGRRSSRSRAPWSACRSTWTGPRAPRRAWRAPSPPGWRRASAFRSSSRTSGSPPSRRRPGCATRGCRRGTRRASSTPRRPR